MSDEPEVVTLDDSLPAVEAAGSTDDDVTVIEAMDTIPTVATPAPSNIAEIATEWTGGPVPRGNALYARLALLVKSTDEASLAELRVLTKTILALRSSTGGAPMWDDGEELIVGPSKLGDKKTFGIGGSRFGSFSSGAMPEKKKDKGMRPVAPQKSHLPLASTATERSASNSDDSNDAGEKTTRTTAGSLAPSGKACIECCESASSVRDPILACDVCTLPVHAKCATPPLDEKEFTNPRFVYSCASCRPLKRRRSESPKPRSAIALPIGALPEGKKKKESTSFAPTSSATPGEATKKKDFLAQSKAGKGN